MLMISHLVVSGFLWPHGLQHTRLPCSSLSLRICSNSCSLSQWCHPLLHMPSIFPIMSIFSKELVHHMRWPKYWSFSISASKNIQCWLPLALTDLISLLSKGLSRVFSSTTLQKHKFFNMQPSLWSNSYICTWLLEKP